MFADPAFSRDPARRRAISHFADFVRAQALLDEHDAAGQKTQCLGFSIPDIAYREKVADDLTFPPLLSSPQFLALLDDRRKFSDAIDMIQNYVATLPEERKWIIVAYKSRFLKSTDQTTYGRLLVFVPNEPQPDGRVLDRWIQFALPTPDQDETVRPRSISMVSVRGGDGRDPEGRLGDFIRYRDSTTGDIGIRPLIFAGPNAGDACYDCHKTAALPIHPADTYTSPLPIKILNDRIAAYGRTDFGWLDPKPYGPSIGDLTRPPSKADVRRWSGTPDLTDSQYSRIAQSMTCGGCHDSFAKLDFPQGLPFPNLANAFSLAQTYVEQGWMPPGNSLSDAERKALWQCLRHAYFDPSDMSGTFYDWLRG